MSTESGELQIALSFSTGAEEFAEEIAAILTGDFGIEHINLLHGPPRGRETMLRIDPVDIAKIKQYKFFSINWKQILLRDFADYNLRTYQKRYFSPEDLGQTSAFPRE